MKLIKRILLASSQHPLITDGAMALLLSTLALVILWYRWEYTQPVHPALAVGLTLAVILPLILRRRFPLIVLLIITTLLNYYRLLDIPEGTATAYALLLALFGAGAYGSQRWRTWARGISVVSVAVCLTYLLFIRLPTDTSLFSYEENQVLGWLATILLNLFLFGAAWWGGDIFRKLRERERELKAQTVQLEIERDENARRAILDERVRIARELHDVVAHHVSVMGVQAGAARRIMTKKPDKVYEALSLIESSSRQAVAEMHRLLGFLRQEKQADRLAPQPSLKQLNMMISDMQEAGLSVEVNIKGNERELPPSTDVSAYRIIQESLTNVLKHAGPTKATVTVSYTDGAIELEITDNGKGATSVELQKPKGRGLIGIQERVKLHSGKFEANNIPNGGFSVRVKLPLNGQ
jgi:signal transduction histidine kinase